MSATLRSVPIIQDRLATLLTGLHQVEVALRESESDKEVLDRVAASLCTLSGQMLLLHDLVRAFQSGHDSEGDTGAALTANGFVEQEVARLHETAAGRRR